MRRHLPSPTLGGKQSLSGMYLLSFAQKRSSTQALCFSATEEESFQMAGWKRAHMMITRFFFFFLVVL